MWRWGRCGLLVGILALPVVSHGVFDVLLFASSSKKEKRGKQGGERGRGGTQKRKGQLNARVPLLAPTRVDR